MHTKQPPSWNIPHKTFRRQDWLPVPVSSRLKGQVKVKFGGYFMIGRREIFERVFYNLFEHHHDAAVSHISSSSKVLSNVLYDNN